MKKLIFTLVLITGLSFAGIAQEKQAKKREASEKLSPEQRNALQLKEMTLHLDLTPAQQKEMAPIIAEQTTKMEAKRNEMKARKEAKRSLTANDKFEMKDKSLDSKIEMKAKMKKILNKEQMEKWEANKDKKIAHARKARKLNTEKPSKEVSE